MRFSAVAARRSALVLVSFGVLGCALPGASSAALARLAPGDAPGPTVEARALAEIGFRVVAGGTPGAMPDRGARVALVPNDPLYAFSSYRWVYERTRFVDAWSRLTGDPRTIIAIVDTGVDPLTGDLQGALLPGWDFYDNDADTSDPQGHGTMMASLAAARINNALGIAGACGRCSILPVRVTNGDGYASWAAAAAGIVWAAEHGARIINISLAGSLSTPALDAAVAYAQANGALLVAAAGNESLGSPAYPAALPGVISAEASDENDNPYAFSNHGPSVTLAAPGCAPAIGLGNALLGACGTSVSTALVAGAAALLSSSRPSATAAELEQALVRGATRVTDSRSGRLDVAGALDALAPAATALVLVAPPTVTGLPARGATLSATPGMWLGGAATYTYQWFRCTRGGCGAIQGATASDYRITSADLGRRLEVHVTAANDSGRVVSRSSRAAVPPARERANVKHRR